MSIAQIAPLVRGAYLDRLGVREVGEEARQPLREHRLPGTGRPHEQDVVAPRRGHFEGVARLVLSDDVGQVRPGTRPARIA